MTTIRSAADVEFHLTTTVRTATTDINGAIRDTAILCIRPESTGPIRAMDTFQFLRIQVHRGEDMRPVGASVMDVATATAVAVAGKR